MISIQLPTEQIKQLESISKLLNTDSETLAAEIINIYLQFKLSQDVEDIEDKASKLALKNINKLKKERNGKIKND